MRKDLISGKLIDKKTRISSELFKHSSSESKSSSLCLFIGSI